MLHGKEMTGRQRHDTEPGQQDKDEERGVQRNKYIFAHINDKLTAAAAAAVVVVARDALARALALHASQLH